MLWALLMALAGLPEGLGGWEVLLEGPVRVACTRQAGPWCRAEGEVAAPVAVVGAILADFDGYPGVFPRITRTRKLAPDLVLIELKMPWPLAPRDYIAHFTQIQQGDTLLFRWEPGEHADAPPGEAVRLVHSAGEWRLEPTAAGQTRVTYTWQADLGGDIPAFALPNAWKTQGTEILGWLGRACEARQAL